MTTQPWTTRRDAKMSQAHQIMREHQIRNLPVLEAGKRVGIVREINKLAGGDPELKVDEAMRQDVYSVAPEDPVDVIVDALHAGAAPHPREE